MLLFAVLGLILWIFLLLLWRIDTKTAAMPVKGEESPPGCGASASEEPTALTPRAGGYIPSTTSTDKDDNKPQADGESQVKTLDYEPLQASSEVNSEQPSLPKTTQKPSKAITPMFSSGPEVRERLKFILGASEDNSSDEEPLVTKPPSGPGQPQTSSLKSPPQQASSTVPQPSSSGIK